MLKQCESERKNTTCTLGNVLKLNLLKVPDGELYTTIQNAVCRSVKNVRRRLLALETQCFHLGKDVELFKESLEMTRSKINEGFAFPTRDM